MIKAIIFDLNGLIIQAPYLSDRFEEKYGVPSDEFLPVLEQIMDKVRRPDAPGFYELWKPYLEEWGVDLSKEEFLNFAFKAEERNEELIDMVERLKRKGFEVYILSNNYKERTFYYKENFPFLEELFDDIYYSWQTGYLKTNSEAYENLLEENNLEPEECVFFDDSEENVEVASDSGINAFLFEGVETLKEVGILGGTEPDTGETFTHWINREYNCEYRVKLNPEKDSPVDVYLVSDKPDEPDLKTQVATSTGKMQGQAAKPDSEAMEVENKKWIEEQIKKKKNKHYSNEEELILLIEVLVTTKEGLEYEIRNIEYPEVDFKGIYLVNTGNEDFVISLEEALIKNSE